MRPTRLMTRVATLRTATLEGVDSYGNPQIRYVERTIKCELQQTSHDDDTVDAHTQTQTFNLFMPPATPADGWAQIVVDGMTMELTGPPWQARNPRTQRITHLQATVRRTE